MGILSGPSKFARMKKAADVSIKHLYRAILGTDDIIPLTRYLINNNKHLVVEYENKRHKGIRTIIVEWKESGWTLAIKELPYRWPEDE